MDKNTLQELIRNGHLRRLPAEEWRRLNEEECRRRCAEALRNPPLTFARATREQKDLLRSFTARGLLPEIQARDIAALIAGDAAALIDIGAENRWAAAKPYPEQLNREQRDLAPAAPEQLRKIRHLIQGKYLNPLSGNTLLKISHLSAKRLIWRGEMNKRGGRDVCHR